MNSSNGSNGSLKRIQRLFGSNGSFQHAVYPAHDFRIYSLSFHTRLFRFSLSFHPLVSPQLLRLLVSLLLLLLLLRVVAVPFLSHYRELGLCLQL
jgi:hypothetical protein